MQGCEVDWYSALGVGASKLAINIETMLKEQAGFLIVVFLYLFEKVLQKDDKISETNML